MSAKIAKKAKSGKLPWKVSREDAGHRNELTSFSTTRTHRIEGHSTIEMVLAAGIGVPFYG